jgi:predicted TIM-barrel fold metal-dependent hydrolase
MRPSDDFRRQGRISFEPEEPYVPQVLDLIGEDRVLFASDFPHPDRKWPEIVEEVVAMNLSDRVKAKILWNNPSAFYGLGG